MPDQSPAGPLEGHPDINQLWQIHLATYDHLRQLVEHEPQMVWHIHPVDLMWLQRVHGPGSTSPALAQSFTEGTIRYSLFGTPVHTVQGPTTWPNAAPRLVVIADRRMG